jgi:hypothetical protein
VVTNRGKALAKKPVHCNRGIFTKALKPVHSNQGIFTSARKPDVDSRGILNKGNRREIITKMITDVFNRLIDVNILYSDFERVLTPSYTTSFGTSAVFLDPPYKGYMDKSDSLYTNDNDDTWTRARDWFLEHRNDPSFRIILCGQNDDWTDPPDDVRVHTWVGAKGMSKREERKQERLYISKYCKETECVSTTQTVESENLFEEEFES